MGSGCTSGHGLCGLALFSWRSAVATARLLRGGDGHRVPDQARLLMASGAPRTLAALACGIIFGLGLAISGMINPAKVIGFLDVAGNWDPTLAFVMGGALLVAVPAYRVILGRRRPVLVEDFSLPTKTRLDASPNLGFRPLRCRLGSRRFLSRPGGGRRRDRASRGSRVRGRHARRHGPARLDLRRASRTQGFVFRRRRPGRGPSLGTQ